MLEDKNDKQVPTNTGGPFKQKEMTRVKNGKFVRTYDDILSTGRLSNKREK